MGLKKIQQHLVLATSQNEINTTSDVEHHMSCYTLLTEQKIIQNAQAVNEKLGPSVLLS